MNQFLLGLQAVLIVGAASIVSMRGRSALEGWGDHSITAAVAAEQQHTASTHRLSTEGEAPCGRSGQCAACIRARSVIAMLIRAAPKLLPAVTQSYVHCDTCCCMCNMYTYLDGEYVAVETCGLKT